MADTDEAVGAELRRQTMGFLQDAVSALRDGATVPGVHKARKAGKRARAAVELARGGLAEGLLDWLDRDIRDAARHLSEVRDNDVMRARVAELGLSIPVPPVADRETRAVRAAAGFEAALRVVSSVSFDAIDADAIVRGLRRSWDAARRTYRAAAEDSTPEALHDWRKRTKRLMTQSELASARLPELKPVAALLDRIQEDLGDHHDLWVLRSVSGDAELERRADARVPHLLASGRWLFRARGKAVAAWLSTRS